MIVSKEKALKRSCVTIISRFCIADHCMAWKLVGISKDMGCCGLVYPNMEIIEVIKEIKK